MTIEISKESKNQFSKCIFNKKKYTLDEKYYIKVNKSLGAFANEMV